MKKEEFIALGISEELAAKAETASATELKGFVPKSRFDEVNEELKQSKEDVKERDKQIEGLKSVDAEGLKKQIETLQEENKQKEKDHKEELKTIKLNNALELALSTAKAKNVATVKPLLKDFMDKAEFDGDKVKGLDEAIKSIKEADETKFLFEGTKEPQRRTQDPQGSSGDNGGSKPASFGEAIANAINAQLGKGE